MSEVKEMTVNELMVLMKVVKARIHQLEALSVKCAGRETFYGETQKVVEPEYDIKKIDSRISELNTFMFNVDSKIKQSNATTSISMNIDVDNLLRPLE